MIWHAYMIEPPAFGHHREFEVAHAFETLGGVAIVPYEVERIRKRATYGLRRIPLLPGYVFAGWYTRPPYEKIQKLDHILGAVKDYTSNDLRPAVLSRRDLANLMAIKSGQDRVAQTAKGLGKGDRVKIGYLVSAIREIVDGKAIVPLRLLGSEREVAIDLDKLEAV